MKKRQEGLKISHTPFEEFQENRREKWFATSLLPQAPSWPTTATITTPIPASPDQWNDWPEPLPSPTLDNPTWTGATEFLPFDPLYPEIGASTTVQCDPASPSERTVQSNDSGLGVDMFLGQWPSVDAEETLNTPHVERGEQSRI